MAAFTTPGWEAESSSIIKATLPTRLLPSAGTGPGGAADRVFVKGNISNGNYDVYRPGLFGDTLIYSRNASTNSVVVHNQALYNARFNQKDANGKSNFSSLDKAIQASVLKNAKLNAGTDPIGIANYNRIAATPTYKSQANAAPEKTKPVVPRQGATPPPKESPASEPASDQSGATLTPASTLDAAGGASGSSISRKKFPENLKYPSDLDTSKQDVLKINMVEYKPRRPGGGAIDELTFGFNPSRSTDYTIIGSVFLPITSGITDTNSVQFGSENMNPLQAELAALALTGITKGGGAAADQASDLIKKIAKDNNPVKTGIAAFFAGAASGTGAQLLTRATGAVLNPNMELLFQAPTLRPFSFTFKLAARSQPEANEIIKIIRFFKQGMAVQRTPSNLFLKTPHTFKLEYLHKGKEHKYLNKFKECALQSFTVDYTPEGNYATFTDGKMVSYQITMQFQELEPIFNDDYGNNDGAAVDTELGY